MVSKTIASGLAALALGAALLPGTAAPAAADPGAFVAGMIGGTALGALAVGAAQPRYYAPAYPPEPVEYYPPPRTRCWMEQRPLLDPYGYVVGYQPTRICR